MFLRHAIIALTTVAMLSASAAAAPVPTTGDPFVDETVATTGTYADQYTSQWIAFGTRVVGAIDEAVGDTSTSTIDASDAVYLAAETAAQDIETAIVDGDVPALNFAIDEFRSQIDVAAAQFRLETEQQAGEFRTETTLETQNFVTAQRLASFAFADDMRSITAQYATDDVAVISGMAAFLTFLALDTSTSTATFVFDDIATETFVVVNTAATGSATTSVGAVRDFGVGTFAAAGTFRTNRIGDVGQGISDAQVEVARSLGEVMATGRSIETQHQTVNQALEEKADEIMGMQDDVLGHRATAFSTVNGHQATVNDIAAGGIGGIGTAVSTTLASGGSTVFGLLTG